MNTGELVKDSHTHLPLPHPPILRKRPVFQPVTPFPFHPIVGVLVLIPELDGDLVVRESEELLSQLVTLLPLPLARQEVDNLLGSGEKLVTVAPDAVGCVCLCHFFGISFRFLVSTRAGTVRVHEMEGKGWGCWSR